MVKINRTVETQERLQIAATLLLLDPATGRLTYKVSGSGRGKVGSRAGSRRPSGYRSVHFSGHYHYEHRVVFALHHGRWPARDLDHVNGIRDDNRIANLRECTQSQNMGAAASGRNASVWGRGVRRRYNGHFCGQVGVNGKHVLIAPTSPCWGKVWIAMRDHYRAKGDFAPLELRGAL